MEKTKETIFKTRLASPLGPLILLGDKLGLRGVYFDRQGLDLALATEANVDQFKETRAWLKTYFRGDIPKTWPRLHLVGTDFQVQVWQELLKIPYGQTRTYGDLAKVLEEKRKKKVAPQAVGRALGANPIAIILPCHRVLARDKKLTGYAGGLDKKKALLDLEGIDYKE